MVEMTVKVKTPGQRLKEKVARKIGTMKRPGIRVEPRDEDMRRLLKHQPSGISFRSEGSVEWPDDTFTHRRIADGSVKVVDRPQPAQTHQRHRHEGPVRGD